MQSHELQVSESMSSKAPVRFEAAREDDEKQDDQDVDNLEVKNEPESIPLEL